MLKGKNPIFSYKFSSTTAIEFQSSSNRSSLAMENLTFSELADLAFRFHSHNSSYVVPGVYDLKIVDAVYALSMTLVFLTMNTGVALLEVGVVSEKNKVNAMMKAIVDICAGGISFWIYGFGLMYGRGEFSNGLFGAGDFFLNAKVGDPLLGQVFTFFFLQMSYANTACSFISGAAAERFRFPPYIIFSFSMTFVYAVGAGWVWGSQGWLKSIGVQDFAGSGPIHIVAGAGCKFLT